MDDGGKMPELRAVLIGVFWDGEEDGEEEEEEEEEEDRALLVEGLRNRALNGMAEVQWYSPCEGLRS